MAHQVAGRLGAIMRLYDFANPIFYCYYWV